MLTACYTSAALLIFGLPSADRRSFTLVGSNEPPGSRALSKTCLFAELRMPKALCHCGGEGADPRSVRSSERKGAPSRKMWAERRSSTGAIQVFWYSQIYGISHSSHISHTRRCQRWSCSLRSKRKGAATTRACTDRRSSPGYADRQFGGVWELV